MLSTSNTSCRFTRDQRPYKVTNYPRLNAVFSGIYWEFSIKLRYNTRSPGLQSERRML